MPESKVWFASFRNTQNWSGTERFLVRSFSTWLVSSFCSPRGGCSSKIFEAITLLRINLQSAMADEPTVACFHIRFPDDQSGDCSRAVYLTERTVLEYNQDFKSSEKNKMNRDLIVSRITFQKSRPQQSGGRCTYSAITRGTGHGGWNQGAVEIGSYSGYWYFSDHSVGSQTALLNCCHIDLIQQVSRKPANKAINQKFETRSWRQTLRIQRASGMYYILRSMIITTGVL